MPTLSPQDKERAIGIHTSYQEPYPVQVQGESFYRKNIEKIVGYYDEDEGYSADDLLAALYLEDNNEFDPGNAVRVEIDDLIVGYLAKTTAKKYRQRMAALQAPANPIGICHASIKGGYRKKGTDVLADFGVRLDFSSDEFTLNPIVFTDEKQPQSTPAPVSAPPPPPASAIRAAQPVPAPQSQSATLDTPTKPRPQPAAATQRLQNLKPWEIIILILACFGLLFLCLIGLTVLQALVAVLTSK